MTRSFSLFLNIIHALKPCIKLQSFPGAKPAEKKQQLHLNILISAIKTHAKKADVWTFCLNNLISRSGFFPLTHDFRSFFPMLTRIFCRAIRFLHFPWPSNRREYCTTMEKCTISGDRGSKMTKSQVSAKFKLRGFSQIDKCFVDGII